MQKTVHIIGAGISGLSAAVRLANAGHKVQVHEATQQAGGRCRSYEDATLGMTIDNGNHLVLSGNRATYDYLRAIGSEARLAGPIEARFDFYDVRDAARWTLAQLARCERVFCRSSPIGAAACQVVILAAANAEVIGRNPKMRRNQP